MSKPDEFDKSEAPQLTERLTKANAKLRQAAFGAIYERLAVIEGHIEVMSASVTQMASTLDDLSAFLRAKEK